MTFKEWDERQDNMTARERGIALSAWVRQDENHAKLVEAVSKVVAPLCAMDTAGFDRDWDAMLAALAALKETSGGDPMAGLYQHGDD